MRPGRFAGQKWHILFFILGMMLFLYPTFSNLFYNHDAVYNPNLDAPPPVTVFPNPTGDEGSNITVSDREFEQIESDPSMEPLMDKELDYIKAYNKKLCANSGSTEDPFDGYDGGLDKFQVSKDAGGASVFAYIIIDRIHQSLPVYLGATDEHLKKGVAVIQGTSIPVGGENTNSVIAGHTGLLKNKFFTDLPQLKPEDKIEIRNRWETLYYKVTGNKLIMPYQEEYLAVAAGKDMITLVTCYHGTLKNDRLLVFAERYYPEQKTENEPQEKADNKIEEKSGEKKDTNPNPYSYISEVELKAKPWYEQLQTFVICAAAVLVYIFIYTLIGKKRH